MSLGTELMWVAPAVSIIAMFFIIYFIKKILKCDEGTPQMKEIAEAVRKGAQAYLKRQYTAVTIFFVCGFIIFLFLAYQGFMDIFVPFGFVTGGLFSALAGYIGMVVATKSSARTANAAKDNLNSALRVAFSGGSIMGLVVVGLALFYLGIWYYVLNFFYSHLQISQRIQAITSNMLAFGFGASSMALFARVGGGIYTKAADMGADLVGKIEANIPEDDPRNPAVIADNVGDNVGDVAGMGADLYESYIGSLVATMSLAVAAGLGVRGLLAPILITSLGLISSIIGTFFVRLRKGAGEKELLFALRKGIFITAGLILVGSFWIIKGLLGMEYIGLYWSLLCGLIAGIFMGLSTEFFTSNKYSPARTIAESALTGPATVIVEGLSVGMLSCSIPVVIIGGTILSSFSLSGGWANFNAGLYGVGIAAVGMLSTLGITLASDAYGPIADNAGGNAEMTEQSEIVTERTDALDSLGNTTAATGKGFAIGSAALTTLVLIAAYKGQVELLGKSLDLSLLNPPVLVGLLLGGMIPFLFCSTTMKAVGRAAGKVIKEVRRQFKNIPGIMEGREKPDYSQCVDIATGAAQKEMILPSVTAILAPIIVGLLIGVEAVLGLLTGALVSGFVLAVMMANTGGAWDNAKKYIETGEFGGKGSEAHKSSVVGDTVGDPFKDTSGPSLNILIKLMSMVSIIMLSFIITYSLVQ